MNIFDRSNCFTQGFLSLFITLDLSNKNKQLFCSREKTDFSGLLGPTITEKGIHFA